MLLYWLLAIVAVATVLSRARFALPGAQERLRRVADHRLRMLHATYTHPAWTELALAAWCLAGVVLAVVGGSGQALAVTATATVGMILGVLLHRSNRARVEQAWAQRELAPLAPPRESSQERRRRQRTLGILAAVVFPVGQVLGGIGRLRGPDWLLAPGLALMLVGFVTLLALQWVSMWRFGDEKPA